jgi:hypothetical protein
MRDRTTYIKLDRNIMSWGWYKDLNTFKLFIHLLLNANVKDHEFQGVTVHRGELATSQTSLATSTGLSRQNIRTALEHLRSTGDITINQHRKFSIISIPRYDYYQRNQPSRSPTTNHTVTSNQPQYKNEIEGDRGRGARSARSSSSNHNLKLIDQMLAEMAETDEEVT